MGKKVDKLDDTEEEPEEGYGKLLSESYEKEEREAIKEEREAIEEKYLEGDKP